MPRKEQIMDKILEWSNFDLPYNSFLSITLFYDYPEISVFWSVFITSFVYTTTWTRLLIISFDFQLPMDWEANK